MSAGRSLGQPENAAGIVRAVLRWYDRNARDLPWRRPEATSWQIMVSEFMLQQTPVARVLGPWHAWVQRWPTPADLAAEPSGEAVRAWGRLGYPRRALRLHQAATVIAEQHANEVPTAYAELLALPGVGDYTAAAIASFAHRRRHVVLDTNIRRVLGRLLLGQAHPPTSVSKVERAMAEQLLPRTGERAARWAVASMELGALICTARAPSCERCPVADRCRWLALGRPAWDGPPRRGQSYEGTDRQCRGALLAVLRSSDVAVPSSELAAAWPPDEQRERALTSLLADGLISVTATGYALPR